MGTSVCEEALKALADGAEIVVQEAQKRAPVETGKMRASIKALPHKNGKVYRIRADATNKNGVIYWPFVEFWPGRERPFMYPALEAKRQEVKEMVIEAIQKAVKQRGI